MFADEPSLPWPRQVSVMTSAAPAIPSQRKHRLVVDLNERASREAA
jgi:hypothetical protein